MMARKALLDVVQLGLGQQTAALEQSQRRVRVRYRQEESFVVVVGGGVDCQGVEQGGAERGPDLLLGVGRG
jgi:hypothetical protein